MPPKLEFASTWMDDDMMQLNAVVFDGRSSFSNKVYVGHRQLKDVVAELHAFKDRIYGGIYDLRFGEFGPEFGPGAFQARLHFHERGKLLITVHMQSEFTDFGKNHVASEATLYLISEPALLDNFIGSLRAVSEGHQKIAQLDGIESPWTWGIENV